MRRAAAGALTPVLLLAVLLVLVLTARARAEEEGPAGTDEAVPVVAQPDEGEALTPEELESWLEERFGDRPGAVTALFLLRFALPIGIGLFLIVRAYRRQDRVRAGLAPPPAPLEPTTPFALGVGLALLVGFTLAGALAGDAVRRARPDLREAVGFQIVHTAAVYAPLAALVLLRRLRLKRTPRLGPRRSLGRGLGAFCVASVFSVPAFLLSLALVGALGREPTVQPLVQEVIQPQHPATPWLIAGFGILVAPVLEETIFRGMLHPAVRGLFGGGRRGGWIAIVSVSALFAASHQHDVSFLPLLALAMVLGWTFEKTDSLASVMVAHGAFNAASLVPMLLARSA